MSQTWAVSRDPFITETIFGPTAETPLSDQIEDAGGRRSLRAFEAAYNTPIYPLPGFAIGPYNFGASEPHSTFDDEPTLATLSGAIRAPRSFLPALRTLAFARCSFAGSEFRQTALIASNVADMWTVKGTVVKKMMLAPPAADPGTLVKAREGAFDRPTSDAIWFLLQTVTIFEDAPGGVFRTDEAETARSESAEPDDGAGASARHVLAARDLRDWLDFTNEDLGKLVGIAEGTIYNWSRTGARPRRSTLRRLFRVHSFLRSLNASIGHDRARTWLATGNPSPLEMLKAGAVEEAEALAADLVFARVRATDSPLFGASDEPPLRRAAGTFEAPNRARAPEARKVR